MNLQGLLMNFKPNPAAVVPAVPRWVEKERSARRERKKAKNETDEKARARAKAKAKAKAKAVDGKEKKEGLDDLAVPAKTNGVNKLSDLDSQK